MPRPAIHLIHGLKAWSIYAAPVRLELVETMRVIAPCSVAELATALDRPADTLYRHVEKLLAIGVVVDAGIRRKGRRSERVFELAGDDFRPAVPAGDVRLANRVFNVAAQSVARIVARTARDTSAAGQVVFSADAQNVTVKCEHAWLSPRDFLELRAMFREIKRFMDVRKARREGRLYLAAFAVVPVHRKRAARVGAPPDPKGDAPRSTAGRAAKASARARATSTRKPAVRRASRSRRTR